MSRRRACAMTRLALAGMLAGCAGAELGDDTDTLVHFAPASTRAVDSTRADTLKAPALQPGALAAVRSAPVTGWSGAGGVPFEVTLRTAAPASAHARRFGTVTLGTSLRARAPNVGQYPCTSCHLGRRMVLADERKADAHRDLKAVHPEQTGATCATCHAPEDVELLSLKSGERATLDHAYRVCAQCHVAQADAWAGGAHGKRLDGWQGRRVVLGCADCHDPHRPTIESRIPFRAPRLERTRSDRP